MMIGLMVIYLIQSLRCVY